jgi:glutathione synthase/RimK-type ligase-like ATP-grasp enzyme
MSIVKKSQLNKKYTRFRPQIKSRHPSHSILRTNLPLTPFKSVIRLGSTTEVYDTVAHGGKRIEINNVESIKISSNKKLMKQVFNTADVATADWWTNGALDDWASERYPIVAKHIHGSRGEGNTILYNLNQLNAWLPNKTMSNYIFEKFYNYALEYRLHVTEDGYFYTCRKALKSDTPEEQSWYRNDSNCVWLLETNPAFNKPNSWDDIVADCVKALKAIGADILSFDVRVQSATKGNGKPREYQEYILLECNSASSLSSDIDDVSIVATKYIEILPKLIIKKGNNVNN